MSVSKQDYGRQRSHAMVGCVRQLRCFLDIHNIPDRDSVRLVIVVEEANTAAAIKAALKLDLDYSDTLLINVGVRQDGADVTIAGIPVSVQTLAKEI